MVRTVHCRLYKKDLPGLPAPPFPGPEGQKLFEEISQAAWQAWLSIQTMLINERQLVMNDPEARRFLTEQREKFFNGEATAEIEGYKPPTPP